MAALRFLHHHFGTRAIIHRATTQKTSDGAGPKLFPVRDTQMNQPLLTFAIGVLSALIGAAVQFFFSRRSENTKHFREMRTRAYADFLSAAATVAIAQAGKNSAKEFDATVYPDSAGIRV